MQVQQGQKNKMGARMAPFDWMGSCWDPAQPTWAPPMEPSNMWSGSDSVSTSGSDNQEIGTWQNPEGGTWGTGAPPVSSNDIIVDTQDKEAWPSIGDQSETASEGDMDNASVKSGSVISSSSNSGQGQGQAAEIQQGQGSSASKNTSKVWSTSFSGDGGPNCQGPWGSNPGHSHINSTGWGMSHPSSAVNNQGPNMQNNPASAGTDTASNPMTSVVSSSSGSWGSSSAVVGSNSRPPSQGSGNGNSMQGIVPASGAQNGNYGPQIPGAQSASTSTANAMSWQGSINLPGNTGLSAFQKEQAAKSGSAWGSMSVGNNSGIAAGLSNITSKMDPWKSGVQQGWNQGNNQSKMEGGSGWGSPSPSPNPHAGTETWGQPDAKRIPQSWGGTSPSESAGGAGWGQVGPPPSNKATGWGDSAPSKPPSSGGQWGDNRGPPASGWGGNTGANPNAKPNNSPWGGTDTNNQSQWGAANPQSQWGMDSNAAGAASGNPANTGGWGGAKPPGPPPTPQPQMPPQNQPPPPPNPQQYPGSWAVPPSKPPTTTLPPLDQQPPIDLQNKEAVINQLVNTQEGWGKRPIRQDTPWDVDETPTPPVVPPMRRRSSSSDEGSSSHWNQNTNGTAIWESSKEGWGGNRGGNNGGNNPAGNAGASSGAEWGESGNGRDDDGGTWRGPPPHQQQQMNNQWNGPPPPSNQWGGNGPNVDNGSMPGNQWGGNNDPNKGPGAWGSGAGSSSSGGSWNSNKSEWGSGQEDNVWDRNGTSAWGSNTGGGPHGPGAQHPGPNKTEMGMWNQDPSRMVQRRSSSSSSWGDGSDGEPRGWQEPSPPVARRQDVDDGTSFWGEPGPHQQGRPPQNWMPGGSMPPGNMPPHNMPPPMGPGGPRGPMPTQPPHQPPPPQQGPPPGAGADKSIWGHPQPSKPSGWGDPSPPINKVNDGTNIWGQGTQQGGKPAQWGDNQWPGSKPKPPGNWGGEATDWSSGAPKKMPFNMNSRPIPQMRSKLLQQLVEMGFKREDAQNALITNNMILESAIADLMSQRRPDEDKGRKLLGMPSDSMSDPQSDPNQFVPPMSLPNTPFPNTQPPLQNSQQQVIPNASKAGGPSLPNMSSLIQQRILQHQIQAQLFPGGAAAQQGRPNTQSVQQQLAQHQLNQMRHINPQMNQLNQQLTPHLRVQVQNLVQLKEVLQGLNVHQQQLSQALLAARNANPMAQRSLQTQLDKVNLTINKIKQQVHQLQTQITQTPQLVNKVPDQQQQGKSDFSKEIGALHIKDSQQASALNQTPQAQQQPQTSRLTQWRLPSPDSDGGLNKAVGSKPATSQPSPSLGPFSDSTWSNVSPGSTATNRQWPTSASGSSPALSAISSAATNSNNTSTAKDESSPNNTTNESKESPTATTAASSTSSTPTPAAGTPSSQNNNNGSTNSLTDMIEEFVPGKPWQGISTKSVEDDPYMTPGSIRPAALSINKINEEDVMTSLCKPNSPSVTDDNNMSLSSSAWNSSAFVPISKAPTTGQSKSKWDMSGSEASIGSELWGVPSSGNRNPRPPPGLTNQNKVAGSSWQQPGQGSQFTRSVSWAPGDRGFQTMGGQAVSPSPWGGNPPVSNCLVLKNLTPQIDGSTLRTLCLQHGPLQEFHLNLNHGHALVRYSSKEEAMKAQKSLNTCVLGNTTIHAEFVSDSDARVLLENPQGAPTLPQVSIGGGASIGSLSSVWSQATPQPSYSYSRPSQSSQWNGATSSGLGGMWGSSNSLWGTSSLDDNLLPGDLLGGQTL